MIAAWATNAPPRSTERSPISSSAIAAEHQDRALEEQRRPVDRERAAGGDHPVVGVERSPSISAASTASRASVELHHVPRSRRGTNASTRTPTQAAPNMIRIGASAA